MQLSTPYSGGVGGGGCQLNWGVVRVAESRVADRDAPLLVIDIVATVKQGRLKQILAWCCWSASTGRKLPQGGEVLAASLLTGVAGNSHQQSKCERPSCCPLPLVGAYKSSCVFGFWLRPEKEQKHCGYTASFLLSTEREMFVIPNATESWQPSSRDLFSVLLDAPSVYLMKKWKGSLVGKRAYPLCKKCVLHNINIV